MLKSIKRINPNQILADHLYYISQPSAKIMRNMHFEKDCFFTRSQVISIHHYIVPAISTTCLSSTDYDPGPKDKLITNDTSSY